MAKLSGLCSFLIESFNAEEFKSFLVSLSDGAELVRSLNFARPLEGLVEDAVAAMERRGLIDRVFFDGLSVARKHRVHEVRLVQAQWAEAHAPAVPPLEAGGSGAPRLLKKGSLVCEGRYRLGVRLGEGPNGQVWRAEDTQAKVDVALKLLRRTFSADPERCEQFYRCARVARGFQDPGIVRVLDVPEAVDSPRLYAMEHVPGGDLHAAVTGGRPIKDSLHAILAIARAVRVVHAARVLHLNIKPSNILMAPDRGAKLTDFDPGDADRGAFTTFERARGAVFYAAPEVLSDPEQVSERADIYSLGMVVLFVLIGHDLTLETVRDHAATIERLKPTAALRSLLRRATAWRPDDRYSSIQGFIEDLDLCLLDEDEELVRMGPSLQARAPLLRDSGWTCKLPARVLPLRLLFVGPVSSDAAARRTPVHLKKWLPGNAARISKSQIELAFEVDDPDLELLFGYSRLLRVSVRSIDDLTPEALPRLINQVARLLELRQVLEEIVRSCGTPMSATLIVQGILTRRSGGAVATLEAARLDELEAVLRRLSEAADSAVDSLALLREALVRLDATLAKIAASVLSEPSVLAIRASWASLRLLEGAYDLGEPIEISVWDIDKPRFVQDCMDYEQPRHTSLAQILDAAAGALGATPFSIVCCGWALSDEPADQNALASAAQVCADVQAVFVTNVDSSVLHRGAFAVPSNWINSQGWRRVVDEVAMRHVAVCFPRFLLAGNSRQDRVGSARLSCSYEVPPVWGYTSVLLTYCAIRSFVRYRVCSFASGLEDGFVPINSDSNAGETEFVVATNTRSELIDWGITTVTCVRSRCYVIESARSVYPRDGAQFPFILLAARIAQSCRSRFRESHEEGQEIGNVESQLQEWLQTLVVDGGNEQLRPLQRASIAVRATGPQEDWMFSLSLAPYAQEHEPVEITVTGSLK